MDDDETFGPTVRLLNGADLLAQLMRCDLAARTCTQGLPEEGAHTMPATRPLKALDVALRAGHESVVEHCTLTFAIRNLSRVASHQLVRHRLMSISQQSLRHSTADGVYFTPLTIREKEEPCGRTLDPYTLKPYEFSYKDEYDAIIEGGLKDYKRLIEKGIPEEDARYVLPMAVCSDMMVTMNLREFIHFCGLRRCWRAQEEIRMLADAMAAEVIEAVPFLRWHVGPQCERLGYCPETRGCGNYPKREMKVDTMPDNHAECPQVAYRDGEWRWDEESRS